MAKLIELFEKEASRVPPISRGEAEAYEKHYELLQIWNEQINLVSRKSIENAFAIHYVDSIQISNATRPFIESRSLCDLGTGAGFPGMVFAIRYPEVPITLYEKSLRKHSFLSVALTSLKVSNANLAQTFIKRSEPSFLLVRAVFPKNELFEFMAKNLSPGSRFVQAVGGNTPIADPPKPFERVHRYEYVLPNQAGGRAIDIIELMKK